MKPSFHDQFVEIFNANFHRLYRYLDRLSGEPELAADIAQDTFVRLYQRGCAPEAPEAWLITVATNLFRNARSQHARRVRLMTAARGAGVLSDPPPSPAEEMDAAESRRCVRNAIDRLPERERRMLLLRAEGYSYRDIAIALDINEASVGTLLARAKRAFSDIYEDASDAP
ncbi:MAG TPA: sigma-70 family RNA polymerase sigma factor [Gemmatimonadaceae bacterium]|jgi:RNA polymerase sigma factor, sigma-70 family